MKVQLARYTARGVEFEECGVNFVRFEVDGKFFDVRIDPDACGLEVTGSDAFNIQPDVANQIHLTHRE